MNLVEIFLPYIRFATGYYGEGSELEAVKSALKVARELYGMEPVAEFEPKKLTAIRATFRQKGWSRPYINRQTQKIVRGFTRLITATALHFLTKPRSPGRQVTVSLAGVPV
jgi:hypothetical protein